LGGFLTKKKNANGLFHLHKIKCHQIVLIKDLFIVNKVDWLNKRMLDATLTTTIGYFICDK